MAEPAMVSRRVARAAGVVGALLAGLLAAAAPAAAQVCLGQPIGGLAARALVPQVAHVRYTGDGGDEGFDVGAAYWANPGGFIAYSAGYARRILDGPGGHVARLELAAELPRIPALPPGSGTCLTAGAVGAWFDGADGDSSLSFPLGAAVGFVLPLGPTARLHPYLHPRLALGDVADDGPAAPWIEAGLGFSRAALVARARVATSFRESDAERPPFPDLRVGLEVGLRF